MMGRGDMDGTGRYPDNLTPGGASWAFDWQRMRGDVRQESLCRTFFVGRRGAGKSTLCNRLCGWDLSRVAASDEPSTAWEVEDFGSFVLLDLPAEDGPDGEDGLRFAVTDLMDAHLVVFVTDLTADLVPTEYRWFSQIRALGRPFVVAGNKADAVAGRLDEVQVERAHRLACSVVPVSALSGADVAERLVPRMIDACPAVAVTLGRDFSTIRRVAAQRAARQAALVSLVAALEPVPLLDIPILIATQSRLVAQLATLYGRDADGDGTRELALATASALAVRLGVQQLLKLVPVFGWLAGGALSGAFTFVLGQALIGHHERGPRPAPPSAPPSTALARRRLRDRWRSWWRDHRRPRPLRQRLRARRMHRTTGRARRIWRRRTRRESR